MEKVGITLHLGYVSPVFDVAQNLLCVSVEGGQERMRQEATLEITDPFLRAQKIRDLGVDVLVCGAVSNSYEMALRHKGIKVIGPVCGPVEDVLSAFLNGTLGDSKFLMPGYTGQGRSKTGCSKGTRTKG